MFCRERQLGPREAADLDPSRRVELARDAGCRFALALQSLLKKFALGVRLGERSSVRLVARGGMSTAGTPGVVSTTVTCSASQCGQMISVP